MTVFIRPVETQRLVEADVVKPLRGTSRSSLIAIAGVANLSLGCPTSRPTARCAIVAPPVPSQGQAVPPQLTIMAVNPVG